MILANRIRLLLPLAGLAVASLASAAGPTQATVAHPEVGAAACADVKWQAPLLADYPAIATACQEVVSSNGTRWARFAGTFLQRSHDGAVTAMINDRRGRPLGRITLRPAPGQQVILDGKSRPFTELMHGQLLSMYVPESSFGIAAGTGVPTAPLETTLPAESATPPAVAIPAPVVTG